MLPQSGGLHSGGCMATNYLAIPKDPGLKGAAADLPAAGVTEMKGELLPVIL